MAVTQSVYGPLVSSSPAWGYVGGYRQSSAWHGPQLTRDQWFAISLITSVISPPLGLASRAPMAAFALWKLRGILTLGWWISTETSSSGGGGPGGVLTSATPPSVLTTYRGARPQGLGRPRGAPPSVEGLGRLINSAHGGGRSGAKPRKRCPPGFYWNGRRCVAKSS